MENREEVTDINCSCLGCHVEGTIYVPIVHRFESGLYCEGCALHLKSHGRVVEEQPYPNTIDNHKEQVKGKKKYYCQYGCGAQIWFDIKKVSMSGKKIPLNLDGSPHRCSSNPYYASRNNTQDHEISCRNCAQPIIFDDDVRAPSGKKIPMNPDRSYHDCPGEVAEVNNDIGNTENNDEFPG